MTVKDLSAGGLKLQINENHGCTAGDVINIEFHLDDTQRSFIKKKVIVRNIHKQTAGLEFAPTEAADKALGFYQFSSSVCPQRQMLELPKFSSKFTPYDC